LIYQFCLYVVNEKTWRGKFRVKDSTDAAKKNLCLTGKWRRAIKPKKNDCRFLLSVETGIQFGGAPKTSS